MAAMKFAAIFLPLLLAACAGMPREGPRRVDSPNHDARRPNFIIIHQTTSAHVDAALRTLTDPLKRVSAHYLIGRDGERIQLVDETRRAWHAGESWWGGLTDVNSASVGIELDNTGEEPFVEAQIAALLGLLAELRERYRIPAANVIGHGDVAPRRKVDPSRFFPWARLAEAGHGLWCAGPMPAASAGFDPVLGLRALGYETTDVAAARRAFRRHFLGEENGEDWRPVDLDTLACLLARQVA